MRAKNPAVIRIQKSLGRTHTGRTIREEAMGLLSSESSVEDSGRGLVECSNCGFVLSEPLFANGCPNCNSREDINTGARA